MREFSKLRSYAVDDLLSTGEVGGLQNPFPPGSVSSALKPWFTHTQDHITATGISTDRTEAWRLIFMKSEGPLRPRHTQVGKDP